MAKPPDAAARTRLFELDGGLYLVLARRTDVLVARRLSGASLNKARKMLEDCHFEIEAHVIGYERG